MGQVFAFGDNALMPKFADVLEDGVAIMFDVVVLLIFRLEPSLEDR